VVTDSETIKELNQQYRGINAPTDVLSFENIPDPDFPEVDQAASGYLGDIIIAYPVAEAQALAAGHAPQDELILLAVHGLLHLLGFDHETSENKQQMWDIQQRIMTELELAHVQPTEN
jgi:probable rRNA maturation factor